MSLVGQCALFAIFGALIISPNVTRSANILGLFINGHRSHMLVYMAVVRTLLERGHNVTLVTTLALDQQLTAVDGMQLRHIQLPQRYTTMEAAPATNGGVERLQRMFARIEHTAEFLRDPVWQAFLEERDSVGTRYDLMLLGYLFNDYQLGVAAHFQCPVALIWTTQPIGFVNSLMGNPEERSYVPQPYDRHQYTGLKALAFGVFEKIVELMALEVMQRIYDEHFPDASYPSFRELRQQVSLALCNHHSLSEGPIAPHVPGIIEIGGIQNSLVDLQLPGEHLPSSIYVHDFIFISFGSRFKWSAFSPAVHAAFLDAFKQLSANFTTLWTYDGDCAPLESIAANIHCRHWWPQKTLLAQPHAKLFITHGGKGSVTEALHYGVPILGIPLFGDQRANIAKMVQRGFGLRLEITTLTAAAPLIAAVEALTQNRTFSARVARFSQRYRDRPLAPNDTAVFWLEYVMRHKGAAHLRSPLLLHYSAWQYYNIDIYAIILLVFLAIVSLCNWLERKLDIA